MATFHLSIKSGGRGKAAEHASYIARDGKYLKKLKENDLAHCQHGNLPEWAQNNPRAFWNMADRHERANGAAYREIEVALPVELSLDQQKALVNEFIEQEIGSKPFQAAIHKSKAALGQGFNDHAHIMFSDRIPDGIERVPEQHFRRHNPKIPEQGGCKKDSGGKDRQALKEAALQLRKGWADLTNQHLERHGHTARVDHRSNKERGITSAPGRHLGPARIKKMKKAADSPDPAYAAMTNALVVLFLLVLADLAAAAMDKAIIFAATHF